MLVHGGVQDVEQPLVSEVGVTSTEDRFEVSVAKGRPEIEEPGGQESTYVSDDIFSSSMAGSVTYGI